MLFNFPFIVTFCLILLSPFELFLEKYYARRARKVLDKVNPFVVLITGSYGKTTVKHLLYNLLKNKYLVSISPKSYNTFAGMCKSINEINPLTKIFIGEAGATKSFDIKKITKLVKPDIGVITGITYQHMSTFKNIFNVINTKWEIVKYSPLYTKVYINASSKFLKDINASSNKLVEVNSFNSYHPCNIKCDPYLSFDIYNGDNFIIHLNTSLIGAHNAYNLTICYALCKDIKELKLTDLEFVKYAKDLTNTSSRLVIKDVVIKDTAIHLIDDSYNANLEGFISALNSLKNTDGITVILTPGIVDLGKYKDLIYQKLAKEFKYITDIYLVDTYEIRPLYKYLDSLNINYQKVLNFDDGIKEITKKYQGMHINLLIENDLPDIYFRRR